LRLFLSRFVIAASFRLREKTKTPARALRLIPQVLDSATRWLERENKNARKGIAT